MATALGETPMTAYPMTAAAETPVPETPAPATTTEAAEAAPAPAPKTEAEKAAEKRRSEDTKRKEALFELVRTERKYTSDLRLIVELFLLPIQYLGNRRVVDVIFGDLVKIAEMNNKMYLEMEQRLGPMYVFVNPDKAQKNKKRGAVRSSQSSHATSTHRSALHGSSLKSPTSPMAVSSSVSNSRRLSMSGSAKDSSSVYSAEGVNDSIGSMGLRRHGSKNDDAASAFSAGSSGSSGDSQGNGHRYVVTGGSTSTSARRRLNSNGSTMSGPGSTYVGHGSVRSMNTVEEDPANDASKWSEDQVLEHVKNTCIGDIMAAFLKDFSEMYAVYSANHEKAIEYLKL
ncbi:hypothetical protein FBU59_004529, partial [Linderina macrospora]